jgi:hypothetical protein
MRRRHRILLAAPTAVLAAAGCSSPVPHTVMTGGDRTTTTATTTPPTLAEPATTVEPEPIDALPRETPDRRRSTTTVAIPANSIANGPLLAPPSVVETLACIRSYEGDYGTDTGNGYYGAYQFAEGTWESVGGSGNPAEASPAEQDARAAELLRREGLAPWPTPSRFCR